MRQKLREYDESSNYHETKLREMAKLQSEQKEAAEARLKKREREFLQQKRLLERVLAVVKAKAPELLKYMKSDRPPAEVSPTQSAKSPRRHSSISPTRRSSSTEDSSPHRTLERERMRRSSSIEARDKNSPRSKTMQRSSSVQRSLERTPSTQKSLERTSSVHKSLERQKTLEEPIVTTTPLKSSLRKTSRSSSDSKPPLPRKATIDDEDDWC